MHHDVPWPWPDVCPSGGGSGRAGHAPALRGIEAGKPSCQQGERPCVRMWDMRGEQGNLDAFRGRLGNSNKDGAHGAGLRLMPEPRAFCPCRRRSGTSRPCRIAFALRRSVAPDRPEGPAEASGGISFLCRGPLHLPPGTLCLRDKRVPCVPSPARSSRASRGADEIERLFHLCSAPPQPLPKRGL